jgi:PadR family transcriptional regulator, regulatory protein PadR
MEATTRPDIPPGTLYMLILKTLSRAGSMHGYGIAQSIHQTSDDVLQVEEGSLYPALQRLLKDGLVDAEWGVSATNRRVRIYRITRAGVKHLTNEVSSFERMLEGINLVMTLSKA